MTALGLLLILLGWILQLLCIDKKEKLHLFFLLAYASGVSFLVIDSFSGGDYIVGSLNLLTLCVVMLVLQQVKHSAK